MTIGGLQKLSLTDFPGRLSAIIFTRGCNFRCPYCHNPELVDPSRFGECLPEDEVFSFLQSRLGQLEGVVVTGGEPTVHEDLPELLEKLRRLRFSIKLDTNGSLPERIESLLKGQLLDYVAIDIKSSGSTYERTVRATVSPEAIRRSVELVVSSGVQHELRLTAVDPLSILEQAHGIAEIAQGCSVFFLQPFQPSKALDSSLLALSRPAMEDLEKLRRALRDAGLPAVLR
jgi:pyruvate formate lyase activating enzyme